MCCIVAGMQLIAVMTSPAAMMKLPVVSQLSSATDVERPALNDALDGTPPTTSIAVNTDRTLPSWALQAAVGGYSNANS